MQSRKPRSLATAGVLAGLVALFVGVGGCTSVSAPGATAPAHPGSTALSSDANPSASSEASSSPSAETPLSPEEQKIKDLELPVGDSNEQLGIDIWQDRVAQWQNAGATVENATVERSKLPVTEVDEKFLAPLAKQNAKLFAKALLSKNWQNDPNLVEFVDGMEKANLTALKLYYRTYTDGHSQKWAYHTWNTINGDITVADATTIVTPIEMHDNSNENRAQYYSQGNLDVDGHTYTSETSFKREATRTVITRVVYQ